MTPPLIPTVGRRLSIQQSERCGTNDNEFDQHGNEESMPRNIKIVLMTTMRSNIIVTKTLLTNYHSCPIEIIQNYSLLQNILLLGFQKNSDVIPHKNDQTFYSS